MSAKQQKKIRAEERAAAPAESLKKSGAKYYSGKSSKLGRVIGRVIAGVVVVGIAAALLFNSPLFYSYVPAITIGSNEYSALEYNYFFNTVFSPFAQYLDNSTPLSKQQSWFGEGTWEEYFREEALNQMKEISMLYDEAKASGFDAATVADNEDYTGVTSVDDQIASLRGMVAVSRYSDFDDYLRTTFGKGMTEEILRGLLGKIIYASTYQQYLINTRRDELTESDLKTYYADNSDEFNLYTYYSYTFEGIADETAGITQDEATAAAYENAHEVAVNHDGEDFAKAVLAFVPDDQKADYENLEKTLHKNSAVSIIGASLHDWLKDPATKPGETTVVPDGTGYTAALLVDRNVNDYYRQSFRDIVIAVKSNSETGEIGQEELNTTRTYAEQIYSDWQSGDATEDTFSTTASIESNEGASTGGLRENVSIGLYTPELEAWLFDPARKYGDTELIFVDSNDNQAYHIVYYVGAEDERNDLRLAREAILTKYYENWKAERVDNYQIEENFGFFFRFK
ncbi:MAG: peptidyl-prolyl cis-trans isomerase [Oscillospiraceae bacterium]|nr:peptidyl-prolyl cis-trans isomerase [Oscillospiraceae bacterium]